MRTATLLAPALVLLAGCYGARYAEVPSDWGMRAAASAAEDEERARGVGSISEDARLERRREYWEGDLERPRHEWHQFVHPGGRTIRHGLERGWHENGALAFERHYEHGRRSGVWRRWYADGARESELSYVDPEETAPLIWWHRNGQISSTGPALGGLREGPAQHFDESGRVSASGTYRVGKREGAWVDVEEDGSERHSIWRAGVRVE